MNENEKRDAAIESVAFGTGLGGVFGEPGAGALLGLLYAQYLAKKPVFVDFEGSATTRPLVVISVTQSTATIAVAFSGTNSPDAVGVVVGLAANPTIGGANCKNAGTNAIAEMNVVNIGLLAANTKYYARTYELTGTVVKYGAPFTFKTLATLANQVTGIVISTSSQAISMNIIPNGFANPITARGILAGPSPDPVIGGAGVLSFESAIGGVDGASTNNILMTLQNQTMYYCRCYVKSDGNVYYEDNNHKIFTKNAVD